MSHNVVGKGKLSIVTGTGTGIERQSLAGRAISGWPLKTAGKITWAVLRFDAGVKGADSAPAGDNDNLILVNHLTLPAWTGKKRWTGCSSKSGGARPRRPQSSSQSP